MIDPQLEAMAQKASNYIPASKRGEKPSARPIDGKTPVSRGMVAGTDKPAVAAPAKPAIPKEKEPAKPFEQKSMPPKSMGGKFNKGAAQRMMGRMS